jgi:hypothetical protein
LESEPLIEFQIEAAGHQRDGKFLSHPIGQACVIHDIPATNHVLPQAHILNLSRLAQHSVGKRNDQNRT